MAIGNPGAMQKVKIGGATSSGPKDGVYRAVVADVGLDVARKSGRPYIALEFHGKGDTEHPSQNGKKILTAKFYCASESDDADKVKQMNGMLKSRLFRGFGIPWPKEFKDFDPRVFLKKEVFIVVGKGKPNEQGDSYAEVKAIALKKDQLPKTAVESSAKGDEDSTEE